MIYVHIVFMVCSHRYAKLLYSSLLRLMVTSHSLKILKCGSMPRNILDIKDDGELVIFRMIMKNKSMR